MKCVEISRGGPIAQGVAMPDVGDKAVIRDGIYRYSGYAIPSVRKPSD